jgi:geranylgeranyl diphosphate synthase type I
MGDLEYAFEAVHRHVVATARGFLNEPLASMVLAHLQNRGKQIRAKVALQAAQALGVDPTTVIPLAAACELLHNATLVHDDLQDGDEMRRGQPSAWVLHGEAQAINIGDVLLMLPTLALEVSAIAPTVRWQISRAVSQRAVQTACGQALELDLPRRAMVDRETYLQAALGKSGPFFALPIESVALTAGFNPQHARALGDATLTLGALFQVRDDILDLYGEKGRGMRGNDLREGKVSALTICHLELHPEDTMALRQVLALPRDETSEEMVHRWSERLRCTGALNRSCDLAFELVERLVQSEALLAEPALHALLENTARRIIEPLNALKTR